MTILDHLPGLSELCQGHGNAPQEARIVSHEFASHASPLSTLASESEADGWNLLLFSESEAILLVEDALKGGIAGNCKCSGRQLRSSVG